MRPHSPSKTSQPEASATKEERPPEGVQLEQPRKPEEEQAPAEVLGDERDCPCRRERAPQVRTSGQEVTQVVELVQAAEGAEELTK